jgi:transketolase
MNTISSVSAAKAGSTAIEHLFPNTIRMLAADAVQKAGSGHPGAPMGQADLAFVLWDRCLKFDPADLSWSDRDRFVLSSGHGCLLLYSLLHLYGCGLSLDDLRAYRQWGSLTPGHPERGHTPGVETTTGPLGQGIANAVGMALAERHLAKRFNREGFPVVDHRTWCICSDGDLMEGVASEAASLAGHLALGKLTVLYDDNRVTIGGPTSIAFTEDVAARFGAYGWHVVTVDGHDHQAVAWALEKAVTASDQPSLILARTHIGFGSPKLQDTSEVHGSPLGEEELKRTKEALGWPLSPAFHVPPEVYAHARAAGERGRRSHAEWNNLWDRYREAHPDLAREFERRQAGRLPEGWDRDLPRFDAGSSVATRNASGKVLNAVARAVPELLGGSADLEPSNKTLITGEPSQSAAAPGGRNIHFGVREHAMGSVANGLAYHGGLRPYNGTFLVFSDYQRPAVRLSALVGLPVVYVYTHDSIGVGGDGPTHQPVEHLISLRAIPGLAVIRPADANETRVAWQVAMERSGPTALILTRQDLPVIEGLPVDQLRRGAYIAHDPERGPDSLIIATGSELHLCLQAATQLAKRGRAVRVVSMPSWELFEAQPAAYREAVLPGAISRRLAVEAGSSHGWWKYVGMHGQVLGVDRFGASASEKRLFEEFGLTVEGVVEHAAAAWAT